MRIFNAQKKYIIFGCYLCFILLAGCGYKQNLSNGENNTTNTDNITSEEQKESEVINKTSTVTMYNPVQESSHDEIFELDGKDIYIPSTAMNQDWVRITTDANVLDEVSFEYEYNFYVYRTMKSDELMDISGMYFDWTNTVEYNLPNNADLTKNSPQCYTNDDGQGIIIWFSNGYSNSIAMTYNATSEKLINMFNLICKTETTTEAD